MSEQTLNIELDGKINLTGCYSVVLAEKEKTFYRISPGEVKYPLYGTKSGSWMLSEKDGVFSIEFILTDETEMTEFTKKDAVCLCFSNEYEMICIRPVLFFNDSSAKQLVTLNELKSSPECISSVIESIAVRDSVTFSSFVNNEFNDFLVKKAFKSVINDAEDNLPAVMNEHFSSSYLEKTSDEKISIIELIYAYHINSNLIAPKKALLKNMYEKVKTEYVTNDMKILLSTQKNIEVLNETIKSLKSQSGTSSNSEEVKYWKQLSERRNKKIQNLQKETDEKNILINNQKKQINDYEKEIKELKDNLQTALKNLKNVSSQNNIQSPGGITYNTSSVNRPAVSVPNTPEPEPAKKMPGLKTPGKVSTSSAFASGSFNTVPASNVSVAGNSQPSAPAFNSSAVSSTTALQNTASAMSGNNIMNWYTDTASYRSEINKFVTPTVESMVTDGQTYVLEESGNSRKAAFMVKDGKIYPNPIKFKNGIIRKTDMESDLMRIAFDINGNISGENKLISVTGATLNSSGDGITSKGVIQF